jgi:stage II sporulation protein M
LFDELKRTWVLHVKKNSIAYLLTIFILITGIMAGAFTVISLPSQQKNYLSKFLQEFFHSQQNLPINHWAIFRHSLWQHFTTAFFIWIFGFFIWGSPFILALIGIRGFYFGFTIGFMVEHYKFGGVLFSLLCILPQSIIYVPCYIAMVIIALLYSTAGLGRGGFTYFRAQGRNNPGIYTTKLSLVFFILLIGVLIETFISPLLFPLFVWIFN